MKNTAKNAVWSLLVVCAAAVPQSAQAAQCYADYKAKKDAPLRLHYGVVALETECTLKAAQAEIAQRLAADDWTLLNVLSVFEKNELAGKEASAGQFFLRY